MNIGDFIKNEKTSYKLFIYFCPWFTIYTSTESWCNVQMWKEIKYNIIKGYIIGKDMYLLLSPIVFSTWN